MQFHVKKFKDFHEFILSRVLTNLKPCYMNHAHGTPISLNTLEIFLFVLINST